MTRSEEEASHPATAPYRYAARSYWQAGWRGVIPLPVGQKGPPPDGYTGGAGYWPSLADIQSWVDGPEGDGNIGLRVPRNMLGLDVDHYGRKTGGDTFLDAQSEYGALPATWRSTSRTDDYSGIYFFLVPEGLWWPGTFGTDTEVVQYRHRYAVCWPSRHPDGPQYTWIDPAGKRTTIIPSPEDFPTLPEPWVHWLSHDLAAGAGTVRAGMPEDKAMAWLGAAPEPGVMCRRTAAVLDRELEALAAGSRHEAAEYATLYFARLAADGHHGVLAALQRYSSAFYTACADPGRGTLRGPGVANHELRSLLVGAVDIVAADTATPEPVDPCEQPFHGLLLPTTNHVPAMPVVDVQLPSVPAGPVTDPYQALLAQAVARERARREAKRIIDNEEWSKVWSPPPWRPDLAAELAIPDEEITWTVEQLYPARYNVLLLAQNKTGKTTMVNHLVKCLVDGDPFLGVYPIGPVPGRVGVWNYEVDEQTYRQWLRELDIKNMDKVVVYQLRGRRMPLAVQLVEDFTVNWLKDHGVSFWIPDPYARAYLGSVDNENDNSQVGRFLETLDVIKARSGVTELLLPVHTGHELYEGAERSRGAVRLEDWCDARWIYTIGDDGQRYFRATGRDVEVAEGRIDYLGVARGLRVSVGSSRQQEKEHRVAQVMLVVTEEQPGLGSRELREAIRDRTTADNKLIEKVRRDLIGGSHPRLIVKNERGKTAHYVGDLGPPKWMTGDTE